MVDLHADSLDDSGDSTSSILTALSLSLALAFELAHAPALAFALAPAPALALALVPALAAETATAERWATTKHKEDCFIAEEKRKIGRDSKAYTYKE